MNSNNSKTSDPYRLPLILTNKIIQKQLKMKEKILDLTW